ncbi:MAG TPA: alcohol dehydrogenase catalytic domain-containing protein, partial [Nitrososphaeraceae archaeon]|nr:alcohol dehydrogenase catalytic domain-containing protein [Nitrososphaeraceae archaeon]
MRAAIFERQGLDNLNVKEDVQQPTITDHDVLIKVKAAGVNPIDYLTVSNMPGIKPLPHIPGAEVAGVIEKVGNHVATLKEGDNVVVYNSIFDGTCDMCLSGYEMLCRNAGILGVITNGGFADYISAAEKNVFKIPDNLQWDVAASLATTTKTPYHALREASLKSNEFLVIFGASGNTGMMAVQFGKKIGAKVIAVSKDNWIKTDFGADYIISDYDKVVEQVRDITHGKMADVVLNSLGVNTWENSFSCVGVNGRWVTFGGLTGAEVKLNIQSLYRKQIKLIGSNGSTRKEFKDVIDMSRELKVRVWKRFKLEEAKEAMQALFAKERDGRILLDINQ